jgi:hypothetical protein
MIGRGPRFRNASSETAPNKNRILLSGRRIDVKLLKSISAKTALALGGILLSTTFGCSQADKSAMKASGASTNAMGNAKVMISPSPVPYQRKVKVTISGTGFAPNQEIELQVPIGGVPSDISAMVKPKPKTNGQGAFNTVWTLDNEIRGKLLEPTKYTLEVLNTDGEVLAKAPFVLEKVETKKK